VEIAGTGTVTSRPITVSKDGIVRVTLQLRGNGPLTEAPVS
jgi:hypothetical protein